MTMRDEAMLVRKTRNLERVALSGDGCIGRAFAYMQGETSLTKKDDTA